MCAITFWKNTNNCGTLNLLKFIVRENVGVNEECWNGNFCTKKNRQTYY